MTVAKASQLAGGLLHHHVIKHEGRDLQIAFLIFHLESDLSEFIYQRVLESQMLRATSC